MNGLTIDMLGMWTPGPLEIIIIGVIALLIFGKRLPEIARGLGKSLTEFKKGTKEVEETKDDLVNNAKEIKQDLVNQAKDAAGLNNVSKTNELN